MARRQARSWLYRRPQASVPSNLLSLRFPRSRSHQQIAGFTVERFAESIQRVEADHARLTVPNIVTGSISQPGRLRQCKWIANSLPFRYLSYFQFDHLSLKGLTRWYLNVNYFWSYPNGSLATAGRA